MPSFCAEGNAQVLLVGQREREHELHEKLNVNHPVHAHPPCFNTVLTKEIMCGNAYFYQRCNRWSTSPPCNLPEERGGYMTVLTFCNLWTYVSQATQICGREWPPRFLVSSEVISISRKKTLQILIFWLIFISSLEAFRGQMGMVIRQAGQWIIFNCPCHSYIKGHCPLVSMKMLPALLNNIAEWDKQVSLTWIK